jgi:hypothetical protein
MKMKDRELVKSASLSRNITEILHFTKRENMRSIAMHGLLSRDQLRRRGIPYHATDDRRLDQRLDFISLSIANLNRKMLASKGMDKRKRSYAVCILDSSVMWEIDCLFFSENAAHHRNREAADEEFSSYEAFTYMLDRGLTRLREFGSRDLRAVPFDEQAEVMVRASIPVQYIKRIEVACASYIPKFSGRMAVPIEANPPRFLCT